MVEGGLRLIAIPIRMGQAKMCCGWNATMRVVAVMSFKMGCAEWMDDAKCAVKRGGVLSSRLSNGH